MRRVIAAINMTVDGFCDHTAGFKADEELHRHYADLLNEAGIILYGRISYQLMQFWQTFLTEPSADRSLNDFANSIDRVQKLVFSTTMKESSWGTARIAKRTLEEEVMALKQQPGKNILVGSRSLIIQLLNSNLLDELQLCIHPVIEGKGLPLFDKLSGRVCLRLVDTKFLKSGATVFYYQPIMKKPELSARIFEISRRGCWL